MKKNEFNGSKTDITGEKWLEHFMSGLNLIFN